MRASVSIIVGREAELARLDSFLRAAVVGPSALVIEGEAGAGKTTLWAETVSRGEATACRILTCSPSEPEATLSFQGLADLLEPVVGEVLDRLPPVQRRALEVALLLQEPGSDPADQRTVAAATFAALRELAAAGPVLVAIDDVQWLDPPSADVLGFAVRRLGELPVRFLVARRSTQDLPAPLGLGRALGPDRLETLRIGPLPVGDLDRLLRANLDLRLPRPRLIELHRRVDGNPFYALEIARASARSGADDLLVPESLGALLRDRLDALPPVVREVILLVAASSNPATRTVERAAGGSEGLAEAVHQEVLVLDGERIRFTHPLLASVSYESAPPWERRAIHSRLAAVAPGSEERARHLALATEEADEAIASELEGAAKIAAARGAPEAAAQLVEHAARLTPFGADADRRRRLAAAAEHHMASGDPTRGRAILRQLLDELPPGPSRAEILWRFADSGGMELEESIRLAEQALEEAGGNPAISAQIHTALGIFTWINGDLQGSASHSRQAAAFAELAGDDLLVAISLGEVGHAEVVLGQPVPAAEMERALALEQRLEGFPPYLRPSFQLGVMRMYTDDPDGARPLLEAELRRIESAGDESARCGVLFRLAELELRSGSWGKAAAYAHDAMAIALQAGIEQEQGVGLMIHGLVQAHLGHLDEARRSARSALTINAETGDRVVALRSMGVLGFSEVSLGDLVAALEWLSPAVEELRGLGTGELSISQVVQNEIEALVGLGRLEEAEATIAFVEEKGRPAGRAWHEAVAQRGRALVASARGDFDKAREHLDRALVAHERLPQPFELGRTLLAQGTIERRAKHRGAARDALTRALELFDQLGAPLWAEKAAAELARIPGRAPAAGELSETERRVAELVASGLANKEVAAKLFVTVRTVEGNLTRIYAKLGVRSRTELAARLGRGSSAPPA